MALRARVGLVVAAALLGAPSTAACAPRPEAPKETAEDLVNVAPDDGAMEKAKADARRTLGLFWSKFDARAAGIDSFSVKVGLPVKDGGAEHLWATPLRRDSETIVVRIANDPVYIKDLAYGDEIEVEPELISDWAYEKNGKLYGHFTTRALLSSLTPEQRAEIEGTLATTPIEQTAK
ncbi:MAG: DUF2314 domain-containing protein [Phenylobacterium sp.]|nr:DUF2314 domain-containing protein [Phenylobacterium sp.]